MNKEINEENWLETDPAIAMFNYHKVDFSTGASEPARGQDWLNAILEPQLLKSVPQEVRDLFEGARGALAYEYFYYPLYSLGMMELFRVADAAIAHKCRELNAPSSPGKFGASFYKNIQWLVNQGVIQLADWDALRDSRNFASHLKRQEIVMPAMAISIMKNITEKINTLFPAQSS